MKILMISNMSPSNKDIYFGSFILNIKDGLEKSGAEVELISISGQGDNFLQKLVKYFNLYKNILNADLDNYDFVHLSYPSHTYWPFLFRKFDAKKLVVRLHGLELVSETKNDYLLGIRRWVSKKACSKANCVVVPSNYFKDEIQALTTPKDIYVYPSGGVDVGKFYITKDYKSRISNLFCIGYVGRIDVLKGLDKLIIACSLLTFDYKLVIVGDGPLKGEMQTLALELGVNATFVGSIPNEKLVSFYNDFHITVFPTERKGESFGNVGIESLACSTPLIGPDFAGLKEYLHDGISGLNFEFGCSDSLAKTIIKFNSFSDQEKINISQGAYNVALTFEKMEVSKGFFNHLEKSLT